VENSICSGFGFGLERENSAVKENQVKAKYLLISYLTAFVGGFCVMALEIVAGRLVARYLGVSLYTWTSVIGVVLAGISLGNYAGGRIADRFSPKRAISALFILASLNCALIPVLNNAVGDVSLVLPLSWPARIFIHVAMIFFLPSFVLGAISPLIATLALEQGFKTGSTIGNIYAWQAAGSIAGTFLTGFFLIAHIGSTTVVWLIALLLGGIGFLYSTRHLLSLLWMAVLSCLVFVAFADASWAERLAKKLGLKEIKSASTVYEKESSYSYISVVRLSESGQYGLGLDGLAHSKLKLDEPTNLEYMYGYLNIFLDVIRKFGATKENPSLLILGGGGYVFPRLVDTVFPKSQIEIVEIDPEVTKAAVKVLGFSPRRDIRIYHLDARNYLEDLLAQKKQKGGEPMYDFIFCDVLFGPSLPYHLTTYEFNEKITRLLKPSGMYVLNIVDAQERAGFLNAMVATLNKSFAHTYVALPDKKDNARRGYNTYVIVASPKEIPAESFTKANFSGRLLSQSELAALKVGARDIVLTDNLSPVDTLLSEVSFMQAKARLCERIMESAEGLIEKGRLRQAIYQFKKILRVDPYYVEAINNVASLMAWQGNYEQAIEYYRRALQIEPEFAPTRAGLANAYIGLGNTFFKEADFDKAISYYKKSLEIEPALEIASKNLNIAIIEEKKRREM
jgi:tetratricopeptide (TPR) repeat protein/MFS family permease